MNRKLGSGSRVQGSELAWKAKRAALSLTFLLVTALSAVAGEQAPALAIKIGEEAVLLADGPGKGQQDTPAVAFG
ncbi:MAG: hypothetical protein C0404_13520, partial [Verrucomicrobia bacterium]|nr:hypothetical protein [Verrucomicrobiota bacterium]